MEPQGRPHRFLPNASRAARWRIVSLLTVHLLIAAHIIHWKLAGQSLSSIQLSEAGRFAAEGVVTAAFILLAGLIVVTAVLGRLFCAWGCHMLAAQELCRFLLGRLGVQPKLVHLRLLRIVPFVAAFYIFVQPWAERAWYGVAFPATQAQFTTTNVWANLPGPLTAVATFAVCSLLMVYFLGSLSFCHYVCPYSALFRVADRFAVGRMRLAGSCDGCARCTAACTTGIRVHEEMQQLRMVANSSCMRCFECVQACPQQAIKYRLGRPPLWQRLRGASASTTSAAPYLLSLAEEGALLVVFVLAFAALHGLYERLPLLLSLGASAIIAYVAILSGRVLRRPLVVLRGMALKRGGQLAPAGWAALSAAVAIALLVAHSLIIQYEARRADAALDELGFPRLQARYTPEQEQLARLAVERLEFCSRYGWLDTVSWQMQLAWLARVRADSEAVERHLRRAIHLDAYQSAAHFNLAKELRRQGRSEEAAREFAEAVRLDPALKPFVPRELAFSS